MKRFRTVLLLTLLAAMLFSLTACTMQEDSGELRAMTDQMIQGLIADDFETCYGLFAAYATREEFTDAYGELRSILADAEGYTLTQTGWSKRTSGGVTETMAQYLLTFGEERYALRVAAFSEKAGLMTFKLGQMPTEEESEMRLLGTPEQTVFLVLGLAETAFMVWMLVDCARRKVKQKWLWILIILFGVVVTMTRTGENVRLNTSIGLFLNYTAKYVNAAGDSMSRIMIPVGALVYLFSRKRLMMTATVAETQLAEPLQMTGEEETPMTQAENHDAEGVAGEDA